MDNYKKITSVGIGGFGEVYMVEVVNGYTNGRYKFEKGEKYAMKINHPRDDDETSPIGELDIFNRVDHPNVVKAYDTFIHHKYNNFLSFVFILPLADYDLDTFIYSRSNSPDTVINIMHQLLCGIHYLHNNNIVHEDIRPRNILIYVDNNEGVTAKITDFSISSISLDQKGVDNNTNTLAYRPPELLKNKDVQLHRYEVDIWALGLTFLKLCFKRDLFFVNHLRDSPSEVLHKLDDFLGGGWEKDSIFTGVLDDVPDLITKMLDRDPKNRITAGQALNHSIFFKENDIIQVIHGVEIPTSEISNINRKILLNWMKDIILECYESYDVLFLAINIFDRYVGMTSVDTEGHRLYMYQLFAIVSIYLSDTIFLGYTFKIEDYLRYAKNKYTKNQFTDILSIMCKELAWSIYQPTLNTINREIDQEKLFLCYLETTTPTLEMFTEKIVGQ